MGTKRIRTNLSIKEVRTLWGLLEHQYIPYTNPLAISLVRKIRKVVENEANRDRPQGETGEEHTSKGDG